MNEPSHRKLAAVLFSDIKGYSQQMGADEAAAMLRLQEHNRIFRAQVELHRGRVVKTVGDAFMVEFSSAVDAVSCALALQRALAAARIEVRIGVHVGDVIAQDNDLFGETVNLAARLEPRAPVGGVCVTEAVLLQVRRKVRAAAVDLGRQSLKNIADPIHLYVLTPSDSLLEATGSSAGHAPRPHRGRRWWLPGGAVAVGLVAIAVAFSPLGRRGLGPGPAASGGVLRVGMLVDRGNLDLYTHVPGLGYFASRYVVEAAATISADGEVVPGVVERWVEREGGNQIDLFLRKTARFHQHPCLGEERPVTKQDLAFSIEQAIRNGATDWPIAGAADFKTGKSTSVSGISAVTGEGPLTLTLARPSPFIDAALTEVMVVPAGLERCGEDVCNFKQPVGTGPFRFARAPEGDSVELTAFAAYSGASASGRPALDGMRMLHLSDGGDGLAMERRGELDILTLTPKQATAVLDGVGAGRPRFKRPDAASDPLIGLEPMPLELSMWGLIVLRGKQGPLAQPAVRQALALALDRSELVKHYPVQVLPTGRLLQPHHLGHSLGVEELALDRTKARALLAQAGFPAGRGLAEISIGVNEEEAAVGPLLVEQAAAVGIRLRPLNMGREGLEAAVHGREVDAAVVTNVEALRGTEPYPCLPAMATMSSVFLGPQPQLIDTAGRISAERDRQSRRALYSQLERELLSALWYIPVAVFPRDMPVRIHLVSRRVQHFVDPLTGRVASNERLPLSRVSLGSD